MSRSTPASTPSTDGGTVANTRDATLLADRLNTTSPHRQLEKERGQALVGGRLRPMEHRRFCRHQRIAPIVEVAVRILHVLDGPRRDLAAGFERGFVVIRKRGERFERLGRALAVDGI